MLAIFSTNISICPFEMQINENSFFEKQPEVPDYKLIYSS
jgi:hypothetical protein